MTPLKALRFLLSIFRNKKASKADCSSLGT